MELKRLWVPRLLVGFNTNMTVTAILWQEPNTPEQKGLKLSGREAKGMSFVLGVN